MRKVSAFVLGAALIAGAVFVAPASALPLVAGATSSVQTNGSLIHQVQLRSNSARAPVARVGAGRAIAGRSFVGRPVVGRPGAVRYVGGRQQYWRNGGWYPGVGAAVGLGILGAAAIAASQQPYYYEDVPACGWERQAIYDNYGNYRGTRRVQVCD